MVHDKKRVILFIFLNGTIILKIHHLLPFFPIYLLEIIINNKDIAIIIKFFVTDNG